MCPLVSLQALTDAGLGLDEHLLRLERTTEGWVAAGLSLRSEVSAAVAADAACVELVGSSSVVGLLSKPIVDLAVGLSPHHDMEVVRRTLEAAGWTYQSDAGENGGHVLVLETRPGHRVAHLHIVPHGGAQWSNYLSLRDLLRRSPVALKRYEDVKVHLAAAHVGDRTAYTEGKTDIVSTLLHEANGS
ncbi:MAG: GrpB family protein [Aquihabitans sp.]